MPAALCPVATLTDCAAALAVVDLDALDDDTAAAVRAAVAGLDRLRLTGDALDAAKTQPTISIDQYAAAVGVNRVTAYAAARAGEFPVVQIGRRIRVPSAYVLTQLGISD